MYLLDGRGPCCLRLYRGESPLAYHPPALPDDPCLCLPDDGEEDVRRPCRLYLSGPHDLACCPGPCRYQRADRAGGELRGQEVENHAEGYGGECLVHSRNGKRVQIDWRKVRRGVALTSQSSTRAR